MSILKFKPRGVCSSEIQIDASNGRINNITFIGGCNGNLQGIASLVSGCEISDIVAKLRGIQCKGRPTSCPDQLAKALLEIDQLGDTQKSRF